MQDVEVELDGKHLVDEDAFHTEFARVFGFPDYYGRNMNAWIDCMSYLDEPKSGISSVTVEPGSTLRLKIHDHAYFKEKAPLLWSAFLDCTEFVNKRFCDAGTGTKIALAYSD